MSGPHVVSIEKLVAGGDGLARMDDGRVVFVPGVLTGEKVEIELVSTTNDFGRGRLLRVVDESPQRRVPPCPHVADGCGGCDWQHLEPAAQHESKLAVVRESFARTARMQVEPRLRVLDAAARRSTVRMVADHNGVLGFREGESNESVRVGSCMVAEPMVNELIAAGLLEGAGEVTIRVSPRTGERGVWCHEGQMVRGLDESIARGARGVVHMEAAGHRFKVSMGSFFQSSEAAADLLVDVVTRRLNGLELGDGGVLVDAYGGVGLFSRALSSRFDEIVLVESNPQACRDAITNLEDCAAVINQSNMEHWDPCGARVVVADPARQGLGKGGVASVVATDAEVVVLVSCDPVAGARDVRMLVDAGYALGEVEVLDIFPETHHVEVVSVLTRDPD